MELDASWAALTADGGQEGQFGWLKDRFGVSWQLIANMLPSVLNGPDPDGAARAMQAMLGMKKLDGRIAVRVRRLVWDRSLHLRHAPPDTRVKIEGTCSVGVLASWGTRKWMSCSGMCTGVPAVSAPERRLDCHRYGEDTIRCRWEPS